MSAAKTYDIVIVGAGAAGLGCALSAAAGGATVLLLEKTATLGGTVARALIHTIAGLFDDQGEFLNEGLPMELAGRLHKACPHTRKRRIGKTWVLNADPAVYSRVISEWIEEAPGIDVHRSATVVQLQVGSGRIEQLSELFGGETRALSPGAVVDSTGDASIARQAGNFVAEGAASGGYIVQVRGMEPAAMEFPKGVAILSQLRKAVDLGDLPAECASVWLDSGVYPDEAYAKFSIDPLTFDAAAMRSVAEQLLVHLRALPGFGSAFVHRYGEPGWRDSGRIDGEYCLTEQDIKQGKRFPDAACKGAWPIEQWHPQAGIRLEYLPPGCNYDIPLSSLKVAGIGNFWAVGKCLSAEPRAQASARVAGTCWAMGEAVGRHITQ